MATNKKPLKLSLSGAASKKARPLDDTLDDFEILRPLKLSRKHGSHDKLCNNEAKNEQTEAPVQEAAVSNVIERKAPTKDSGNLNKKTGRRTSQKKLKAEETDVSLALALSASMATACENARVTEENFLMEEGLGEVLAEFRQEEVEQGSRPLVLTLGHEEESYTAIKKPPKRGKPKKCLKDFVLAVRSSRERERLIAEKAAMILTTSEATCFGKENRLEHPELHSTVLREWKSQDCVLWKKSALVIDPQSDLTDYFYIPKLYKVLSPRKASSKTSTLFHHWSQIPGRSSSPVKVEEDEEEEPNTQAILEGMFHQAQGGFVDEETKVQDSNQVRQKSLEKLASDWSHLLDNSLLSDLTVLLSNGRSYRGHRLVLAARSPNVLEKCRKDDENRWILDMSEFEAEASVTVLEYLYTGNLGSRSQNCKDVLEIAAKFNLKEVIEFLGGHTYEEEAQNCEEGLNEGSPLKSADRSLANDEKDSPFLCETVLMEYPAKCDSSSAGVVSNEDVVVIPDEKFSAESPARPADCSLVNGGREPPRLSETVELDRSLTPDLFETHCLSPDNKILENEEPKEIRIPEENAENVKGSPDVKTTVEEVVDLTQDSPNPVEFCERNVDIWADFDEANYDVIYEAPQPTESASTPRINADLAANLRPNLLETELDISAIDANDSFLRPEDRGPNENKSSTPHLHQGSVQRKRKRETEVTPLPDYNSMPTPQLKQALDKYGLKPLKRKNAVKLLEHIYEELHPLVTDSESSSHNLSTSLQPLESDDEDDEEQTSADSLAEETVHFEEAPVEDLDVCTQETNGLSEKLKDFLKKRKDIYNRVLMFEPLPLEWLMAELKTANIKCKTAQLLDWLDEQCIAFRMKNRRNNPAAGRSRAGVQ